MFTEQQTQELEADLDAKHVAQRKAAFGGMLSYIEGWHAIAEANRVFGFGNWDRETIEIKQLGEVYQNAKANAVVDYMARVRVTVRGEGAQEVVREGCGFGSGFSKQPGDAHESAIKESETDAMKRALMTFGWSFGLALYDKTQAHVSNLKHKPQPSAGSFNADADNDFPSQELDPSQFPSFAEWDAQMRILVSQAPNQGALKMLWTDNATYLKEYASKFQVMHDELKGEFTARKEML